jgi:acetyl esterase
MGSEPTGGVAGAAVGPPSPADPVLEPAAARFVAAEKGPSAHVQGWAAARQHLEDLQSAHDRPVAVPEVDSSWVTVEGDPAVRARIVRPADRAGALPAVVYLHGGGWVLGSAATHDRLVRELATGADAAVVFVEYDRSPEARYPVALHQAYAVARWVHEHGAAIDLDPSRVAVAGDSSGGNLAAALAILAKQRGDVTFLHQSLYYPALDAAQDTASYRQFAHGPHLTADLMRRFWDAYLPDLAERWDITASPACAGLEELAGLPETFVAVAECDVLRDEGEAYARTMTAAGVRCTSVRFNATLHDFMMLDVLRPTAAATAAIHQAVHALRHALHDPNGATRADR